MNLSTLEHSIEHLLNSLQQLKQENADLKQKQIKLASERNQLAERQRLAIKKIDAMTTKLKSLKIET